MHPMIRRNLTPPSAVIVRTRRRLAIIRRPLRLRPAQGTTRRSFLAIIRRPLRLKLVPMTMETRWKSQAYQEGHEDGRLLSKPAHRANWGGPPSYLESYDKGFADGVKEARKGRVEKRPRMTVRPTSPPLAR